MTRSLLIALVSALVISSAALAAPKPTTQDQLIQAQADIISLKDQMADLQAKIVKSYDANTICHVTHEGCDQMRNNLNRLSGVQVAVETTCELAEDAALSSDCAANNAHWFLKTKVRILQQQ